MRSDELTADRILAAAEREYPLVRAEMVRLARDLWPAWCGDRPLPDDDGAIVRGVLDAGRRRAPEGRRPARLVPRGDRADRGVLRGARRHRPRRRAAGDPVDARLPARVRRRDAVVARAAGQGPEGVLRDHPDARRLVRGAARVVPARGQRADAPAAVHPRSGAGPLPPGRLRQPLSVARPEHLRERAVRRGLGRLRDPGDDGPRLRRRRSGAPADPLEVLPALDHQHHHRRADPLRWHDRATRRSR